MLDASELHALGRRYAAANCHERKRLVVEFAAKGGVVAATVRRHLARVGYRIERKARNDAGATRVDAARVAAAMAVIKLKQESRGALTTAVAIDVAKRKGMIATDLSEKTMRGFVDRMIIRQGIHLDKGDAARRPARRINWQYPGHCLQLDSTNCAQWFIKEPTGIIRLADKKESYCNKPNQTCAIIRYMGVDAASGCFRVRYYQTNAERADDTLDFLMWLFEPSSQDAALLACDPLHGLPEVLMVDRGSGNTSSATRNFCEALGIEMRFHLPGNPRAKGCVERHHGWWGQLFESQLAFDPATSIEELNRRATEFSRKINSERQHYRLDMSRAAFYSKHRCPITLAPPRDVCIEAAHSAPETRRVTNEMWVELDSRRYYVGNIDGLRPGDRVTTRKLVLDAGTDEYPIRVQRLCEKDKPVGATYRVCAMMLDGKGRFNDVRLYHNKEADSVDARDAATTAALDAVLVPSQTGRADANLPAMPAAPAATLTVMPTVQQPKISRTTALLRLRQMIGRELQDAEFAGLTWGEWVDQADVSAAARRMASVPAAAARFEERRVG